MGWILTELTMFLARLTFRWHRMKNPTHTLFYLRGTGRDYPRFLAYSESVSWTEELSDLCTK